MPYRVVPDQGTPLFADHKKTLKKGTVDKGTEFVAREYNEENDVLKADSVPYHPKKTPPGMVLPAGATINGDGWIEFKNVAQFIVTNPPDEPGQLPLPGVEDGQYLITVKRL